MSVSGLRVGAQLVGLMFQGAIRPKTKRGSCDHTMFYRSVPITEKSTSISDQYLIRQAPFVGNDFGSEP